MYRMVDVSHGFLRSEVSPYSCFQRTYQAFHGRSFGFLYALYDSMSSSFNNALKCLLKNSVP